MNKLEALFLLLKSKKTPVNFLEDCFKQQLEVAKNPAKKLVVVCGRQSGKSTTSEMMMLNTAYTKPNAIVLYLGITRQSAKKIMWNKLIQRAKRKGIELKQSLQELTLTLPNGSQIILQGVNTTGVGENIRGLAYDLVIIDECASFRSENLEYVVDECISPALLTRQGQLMLVGTPSGDKLSLFYKAWHDTTLDYTRCKWTIFDNPFQPHALAYIDNLKKKRGWTDSNPILQREYYGNFVFGGEKTVYSYNPNKCLTDSVPKGHTNYVFGIDLGGNNRDATGIIILAFNPDISDKVYVVHYEQHKVLSISQLAEKLQALNNLYKPIRIVCDGGGLGISIVTEINQRHSLNIIPAEKVKKLAFIELLNTDMNDGKVQILEIPQTQTLQDQLQSLIFKENTTIEHPSMDNTSTDCLLYAWRECKHYFYTPKRTLSIEEEMYERFEVEDKPKDYFG